MRAAQLRRQKARQSGLGGELRLQRCLRKWQRLAASLPPTHRAPGARRAERSPWSRPDCPASRRRACVRLLRRDLTKDHRLARLNLRAGKEERGLEGRQHLLDKIVLAHRHAAGDQQQIGFQRPCAAAARVRRLRRAQPAESAARRRPPAPARPASSCWNCESRLGPAGRLMSTTSSPVARIATRGRRYAATSARPTAAATATTA